MKVCVDDREKEVIPRFREFINSGKTELVDEMEVARYDVSDAHTEDMLVGIERKAKDFVESMFKGQLDKQLKELVDNFEYPFLFIEYDGIKDMILDNQNVNPRVLIGEYASILARHKVSVMFTGKYNDVPLYVPVVVRLIEKFYDGKNKVKEYSPIRKGKRPHKAVASPQEFRLDIMSRLPKVGSKKGVKLMEKFHLIIVNNETGKEATVEELMEVDGVGQTLATKIKEVLK